MLVEDELDVEELVVALWKNKLGVKVRVKATSRLHRPPLLSYI